MFEYIKNYTLSRKARPPEGYEIRDALWVWHFPHDFRSALRMPHSNHVENGRNICWHRLLKDKKHHLR